MAAAPLLLPLVRLDELNGTTPQTRPAPPQAATGCACAHCGLDAEALVERAYQAAYDEIERQLDRQIEIVVERRFPR